MPRRGRPPLLAGLGFFLGICASGGCQTLDINPLLGSRASGLSPAAPAAVQARAKHDFDDTSPVAFRPPKAGPMAGPMLPAGGEVVAPGTVLYWNAQPGMGQSKGIHGQSTIKPDGTMNLGPYGTIQAAGLTTEQVRAAVAQRLSSKMPRPRITLTVRRHAGSSAEGAPAAGTGPEMARVGHSSGSEMAEPRQMPVGAAEWSDTPKGDAEPKEKDKAKETDKPPVPRPVPAAVPHDKLPPPLGPGGPPPVPNELAKRPLPPYIIEPPDILLIETRETLKGQQPIGGQHLVRPDGTVGLGVYGSVFVSGMTIEQARQAIADYLRATRIKDFKAEDLNVDVLAYNSKVYYIILDGAGYGQQVYRLPVTGSETVLDAVSQVGGLQPVAARNRVWVARRTPDHGDGVLPVDWVGITQHGTTQTNYQIMPGDRIFVQSDCWRRFDTGVAKVLSPFERMIGATLLGASTVQTIRGNTGTGGTGLGGIR